MITTNVCLAVLLLVYFYAVDDFGNIAKTEKQYEIHRYNLIFAQVISLSEMQVKRQLKDGQNKKKNRNKNFTYENIHVAFFLLIKKWEKEVVY